MNSLKMHSYMNANKRRVFFSCQSTETTFFNMQALNNVQWTLHTHVRLSVCTMQFFIVHLVDCHLFRWTKSLIFVFVVFVIAVDHIYNILPLFHCTHMHTHTQYSMDDIGQKHSLISIHFALFLFISRFYPLHIRWKSSFFIPFSLTTAAATAAAITVMCVL